MAGKLIYCLFLIMFVSCCDPTKEKSNKENFNIFDNIQGDKTDQCEEFIFKGSLKDWFELGCHEGYFFPLSITDIGKKDSIDGVYLEYDCGVYLIRSNRLGLNIRVPFFSISESYDEYCYDPLKKFDYYNIRFRNNLMFKRRSSYLDCQYRALSNESGSYQVIQKEIYQPNFEDPPQITGYRIFTISLKEGAIRYELKGKFEKEWY